MTIRAIRQYPRIEAFESLKDSEAYLRKLLVALQEEAVVVSTLYHTLIEGIKAGDEFNVIEILDTLPDAGNAGRVVFLTADQKLYIDDGANWIVLIVPVTVTDHIGGDSVGTVDTAQIANAAIETAKIANAAVEAGKIAALAVTEAKIAALAVSTAKIAAQAVETAKIANLAVEEAQIAAGAATEAKIGAGAITVTKIGTDAVETAKIKAGAVEAAKIAAGAVIAEKIAANAVIAVKINAGAVTTAKLDALAVTADKIGASAITTAKLDALAITAAKIAAGAIETAKIAAGAVEAVTIAAGAVTTLKLGALAVTAAKIAALTITAGEIAANAIETDKIKALAVTAAKIAADTITAAQIAAGTITAAEINAGTITADELILTQRVFWYSLASATLRNSNDAEKSVNSATYVKLKETKLNEATGVMRLYFEMKSGVDTEWVFAKIYKNGVALGTEQDHDGISYTDFSEDLGAFAADDLLQIYVKGDVTCYIRNFRLKYNRAVTIVAGAALATPLPTVAQTIFSVTNQDP